MLRAERCVISVESVISPGILPISTLITLITHSIGEAP